MAMPQRGTASATAATFAPNRPRSAAPLPHAQPAAWPLSCIELRLRRAHRGERRRAVLLRRGFGAARTWEGAGARPDAAVVGAGGWPDREAARWRQGRSRRRYCLSHVVLPASRPCLPQQVLGAVQQLRRGSTTSCLAEDIGRCHAVDGMASRGCWGGLGAERCRQPLFRTC
jgi:hypothetical protein